MHRVQGPLPGTGHTAPISLLPAALRPLGFRLCFVPSVLGAEPRVQAGLSLDGGGRGAAGRGGVGGRDVSELSQPEKGRDKSRNKDGRETDGRPARAGDTQGLPRQTDRRLQWGQERGPGDQQTGRETPRPWALGLGLDRAREVRGDGAATQGSLPAQTRGDTEVGPADQPPGLGSAQGCSGARWAGGFSGSPDQGCWPDPEMELRDPVKQEDGDPEVRGRR